MTAIDFTGLELLGQMGEQMDAAGLQLHLAEVRGPVHDVLERAELWDSPGRLVALATMLTAAVTGARPDFGDNATVQTLAERLAWRRVSGRVVFVPRAHRTAVALVGTGARADLGTAREVVGRTLKAFERAGWVKLSRGGAEIVDARALRSLCESERD